MARRRCSATPVVVHESKESTLTAQDRAWASKFPSAATSCSRLLNSMVSLWLDSAPLSIRASVRSCPISSSRFSASSSMRSRYSILSSGEHSRSKPRATHRRARGERNSPRHVVEAQAQTANFISPPSNALVSSRIKLAVRDSSGRFTQLHYGPGDVSSEPEAKDASDQQNHKKADKRFKSKSLEQRQERRPRKDQKHRVSIPAASLHALSGK